MYLKGAAAPPAAGPFNSTLHTGDPMLGLNVFVALFHNLCSPLVAHGFQLRSCKSIPSSMSIVLGLLSGNVL